VPVYVVVDESAPSAGYLAALNKGLGELPALLARNPEESAAIRLTLIGYADSAAVRMPLTALTEVTSVHALEARSGSSLAPVLQDLRARIEADVDELKARGLTVGRPTVVVLGAAAPTDAADWPAQLARLTDRAAFRYAPNIVACGIGRGAAGLAARLATQPEQAFVALVPDDFEGCARAFTEFLARFLVHYGRDMLTGRPSAAADPPGGFVPADADRPYPGSPEPFPGG
jgi:uncharacterized protein YegL